MAGDPKRLAWIRRQACACCGAPPPSHAHHHTTGLTASGKLARAGLRRGVGQKADDTETLPLCLKCHGHLHDLRGFFSGYMPGELREWQDRKVAEYQALYEAELAARGEDVPAAGPTPIVPVPSSLDAFDPKVAAAEFCSAYDLAPQVEHDLERLLVRAVIAAREGKAA